MSDAIPRLQQPPTAHSGLTDWVADVAALTRPDRVQWCDGSQAEWDQLTSLLVEQGTLMPLNPDLRPDSFLARSDPSRRRPRRGPHLHLLGEAKRTPGPTNNWIDPARDARDPRPACSTAA